VKLLPEQIWTNREQVMDKQRSRQLSRLLWGSIITMVLALVFIAYLRPSFILDLANRFVMC